MAHLPPVHWSEVATKADLDALETNIHNGIRGEFYEAMNRQIKWLVGFAAVWSTVLITAVRLIP